MTLNSSLDVFFHMRNHYRRLRKVKSVTDSNCPSAKGRNCKSGYNSVNSEQSGRARARSSSGTRPPTRRNPKDMPQEKSKSLGRSEEKPSDVINVQEYTGAKQSQSQQQHEYLQFSLRITEDIIKNDLYSNDQMKQVLASHFHANKGRLDSSKMIAALYELCDELNIPICEEVSELQTPPQPKKHDRPCICPAEQAPPSLNCECTTARKPPITCSIHDMEKLPPPPAPSIAINVYHLLSEKPEVQVLHRADNFKNTSGSGQFDELLGAERIISSVSPAMPDAADDKRMSSGEKDGSSGSVVAVAVAEEPEWVSGVEMGYEELEEEIKVEDNLLETNITTESLPAKVNDDIIIIESNKQRYTDLTNHSFPSTVAIPKSTSMLTYNDNGEVKEEKKSSLMGKRYSVDPSGGFDSPLKPNTLDDNENNILIAEDTEIEKCSCESISCDRSNCAPEELEEEAKEEEEYELEAVSGSSIIDVEVKQSEPTPIAEAARSKQETVVEETSVAETELETETEVEVVEEMPKHCSCMNESGMANYLNYYNKTMKHPTHVRQLGTAHYINSIEPSVRKTEVTVQTSFAHLKEATNKSTNTDIPKQLRMEAPLTAAETDDDFIIIEGPIIIPKERVQRSNELLKSTQVSQTYFNTLYKKPCNVSFPSSTLRPITPYTITPSTDYDMTPQRDILSRNTSCNTMNCLLLGNQYDKHPNLSYFYPNATTQVSSTDLITKAPEPPPSIVSSIPITEGLKKSSDITSNKSKMSSTKQQTLKSVRSFNMDNPQRVYITTEGHAKIENPVENVTYMDNEQKSYGNLITPKVAVGGVSKRNASTSTSLQRKQETTRMTNAPLSPSESSSEIIHPMRVSDVSSWPREVCPDSSTASVDLRIRCLKEDLEKYRIGQMECMPTISRNFPMDVNPRGVSIAHGVDLINMASVDKGRLTERTQPSAAGMR